jgi:hypothetical protein
VGCRVPCAPASKPARKSRNCRRRPAGGSCSLSLAPISRPPSENFGRELSCHDAQRRARRAQAQSFEHIARRPPHCRQPRVVAVDQRRICLGGVCARESVAARRHSSTVIASNGSLSLIAVAPTRRPLTACLPYARDPPQERGSRRLPAPLRGGPRGCVGGSALRDHSGRSTDWLTLKNPEARAVKAAGRGGVERNGDDGPRLSPG